MSDNIADKLKEIYVDISNSEYESKYVYKKIINECDQIIEKCILNINKQVNKTERESNWYNLFFRYCKDTFLNKCFDYAAIDKETRERLENNEFVEKFLRERIETLDKEYENVSRLYWKIERDYAERLKKLESLLKENNIKFEGEE